MDPAPAEGRRVLVAVDEGDESAHALRWCLANFAARGDTVLLLYVRAPPPTYSVLDATGTYLRLYLCFCSALRESIHVLLFRWHRRADERLCRKLL
jgi:nucleotide-binding universal stress UspA family protein